MKNMKLVQVCLILVCLMGYYFCEAQPEYVVTSKGDTILGKVKYLNFGVEKRVQVTTSDSKKSVFSILQAPSFFFDQELYHAVRNVNGYTYMKVLKYGYLSLYAFQQPNQLTWDGRYLLKRDGTGMEVPNISFKKLLKKFLADCPEVTARIESGEFSKTKLNEMVDGYNQCIDLNTKNQHQSIQLSKEQTDKISTWTQLENNIKNLATFESQANALEMIDDIKAKINKGEKIPNFLVEGLKDALKNQPTLQHSLEKALLEIKN
jgi:hypothetical protein